MSTALLGGIAVCCFLILALNKLPLAFSFALVGFVGIIAYLGFDQGMTVMAKTTWSWATSVDVLPLPMFVLMGHLVFHTGISDGIFQTAYKWVGKLPGGIAQTTMVASAGFAACSGSGIAATSTMTTIAFPEMEKYKYDQGLSTSVVIAGGGLAALIPPSVPFIIFGFLTSTSIGALFMAGIGPGFALVALYMLVIHIVCVLNPAKGPRGPRFSWKERLVALKGAWGILALFALVIGGLYAGLFTPSEAGVIGAFGAFVVALIQRRLTVRAFMMSLKETLVTFSFIGTMFIGVMLFNSFLGIIDVPALFTDAVVSLPFSRYVVLAIALGIFIPLGMIMDVAALTMLVVPILVPPLVALGFDPLMLGVEFVLIGGLGNMSPPVALTAFVVQGITKVPLRTIFKGLTPFIGVTIVGIILFAAVPQICTWLPSVMK